MTNESNPYDSDAIGRTSVATPTLADVRRQPDRYLAGTGAAGIEHLCLEVVMNSIDEFNVGHATSVAVSIGDDGSIFVRDDGRGIPVDTPSGETRSALEIVFLEPGAGAKGSSHAYPAPVGANGMGVSVVTALSSRVVVWVERHGKRFEAEFSSSDEHPGRVVRPVTEVGGAGLGRTTAVQFWPDPAIFGDASVDVVRLAERLALLAAVTDGLVVTLATAGAPPRVLGVPGDLGLLGSPSTATRKYVDGRGRVVVVLGTRDGEESRVVRSFVNGVETVAGDHVEATRAALGPRGWDAVVSVWVRGPRFERSDADWVASSEAARDLVAAAFASDRHSID